MQNNRFIRNTPTDRKHQTRYKYRNCDCHFHIDWRLHLVQIFLSTLLTMNSILLAFVLSAVAVMAHGHALLPVLGAAHHGNTAAETVAATHNDHAAGSEHAASDLTNAYHSEHHSKKQDVADGYGLHEHAEEHHGQKDGVVEGHTSHDAENANALHDGTAKRAASSALVTTHPVLGVHGLGHGIYGSGFGLGRGLYVTDLGYGHGLYGLGLGYGLNRVGYGLNRFGYGLNSFRHGLGYGLNGLGYGAHGVYRGYGSYGNGHFFGHF